jgi:hypothetical protein
LPTFAKVFPAEAAVQRQHRHSRSTGVLVTELSVVQGNQLDGSSFSDRTDRWVQL